MSAKDALRQKIPFDPFSSGPMRQARTRQKGDTKKAVTEDMASYARLVGCPFVHVHTRLHTVKQYGSLTGAKETHKAAKRKYTVSKETVYQGPVLTVNKYQLHMPNGETI